MNDIMTTAVEVVGCALIVAGVAMVYVPVALIVAGAMILFFSWLVSR